MTLLLCDGFDDGLSTTDGIRYAVVSGTITTTTGRTGSAVELGHTADEELRFDIPSGSEDDEIYVGFALQVGSLANRIALMKVHGDAAATQHLTVTVETTGALQVRRGTSAGTTLGTTTASLVSTSQWHYFEFYFKMSDTTGAVTVRRNGTNILALTSVDTKNAGTLTTYDAIALGGATSGSSNTLIDDLYILNTAGTTNNGFLGDVKVETLYPSGNGNYSQLTGSDGNSTDNYLLVDEATPDTADYSGSATDGLKDTYAFGDLTTTSGTVYAVQVNGYAAKSDAGAKSCRLVTRVSSTDYTGSDVALSTSYDLVTQIRETNPNTATSWTISEVNGSEFGFEVRA